MNEFALINKAMITVIGIACQTANTPDGAPIDIPKQWGKFYQEGIMQQIPNRTSEEIIALYCDYEGDFTQPYTFVLGCQVTSADEIPAGMVAKQILAGRYAMYSAVGEHPKTLIETWQHIWQEDKNLKRTYKGDYEVYGDKFFLGNPQQIDVFIGVEG